MHSVQVQVTTSSVFCYFSSLIFRLSIAPGDYTSHPFCTPIGSLFSLLITMSAVNGVGTS